MTAVLRRGIAWYDGHLKAAPIKTKILTSVSILSVADVIRQGVDQRRRAASTATAATNPAPMAQGRGSLPLSGPEGWDCARTARMSLWGCTGHPLVIHHWMNVMERWQGSLPASAPKSAVIKLAARKVCIDQFTASPVFLGAFLCWSTLLEGKGLEGCREKLRDDWWTMIKFGWSTWFVGHFISFALVPVHWRVLYINIVSIGFGTVLSQVANLPPPGAAKGEPSASAVLTPVDMLYQQWAGPDAVFWSAEGASLAIGAAWVAAAGSIVYHRAVIGPVGLGCSVVGLAMWGFEADAVWRLSSR